MVSNTSASGGYLAPNAAPAVVEDDAFENFLHNVVADIIGIKGDLVRPRWQPEPGNLPAFATDWIAFGVMSFDPDFTASIEHVGDDNGSDEMQRHETVEVMVSAYGPNASKNLRLLRDGLQVPQNREAMFLVGVGLQETGRMVRAPLIIKERWTNRYDMNVVLRRQVRRVYPVLNLLSLDADSYINNGKWNTPINVTAPA